MLRNKAADDNAPPIPPPLTERAARESAEAARVEAEERAEKQREAAEAKARKVEPNPSRIWVQVASGANRGAMPKAWSAVKGKNASALRNRTPALARAGATNRLLVGPFTSEKEARAVVNKVAGSFMFTSRKGEEITTLAGAKIQVKAPAEPGRKASSGRKTASSKKATSRKSTTSKKSAATKKKAAPKKKAATTTSKKAAPKKKKK
nr:SPOR domain-containing protein [Sphingomonas quercus]